MKKYKWVQRAICFIIGHDVEWVIEHRLRYGHISLNRKGGKKAQPIPMGGWSI